jgi:hypothetical protein
MAVPTGTFQTFQQIGNREDLSDIIDMISPTETPFVTGAKKKTVKATYHEWQTDELDAAAENANVDGDDASTNTATPTVRLRNYVQYLDKVAQVSAGAEAVDHAGRDSEMNYQVMKRGKELKRDLEYACVRNQSSTAGSSASAPLMASVESWIASNRTSVGLGTAQTTPGYSGGTVAAPTDSTVVGTLTEAALKAVIQACYVAGGEPDILMVGPAMKSKISSGFSGIATRFREVASGKQAQIIAGADLYVSDFGEHKLVPNRFMRDRTILVLDMSHWAIGSLIPWTSWNLAKTGASTRKQLYGAYTLISLNEKASGKVADASTSL